MIASSTTPLALTVTVFVSSSNSGVENVNVYVPGGSASWNVPSSSVATVCASPPLIWMYAAGRPSPVRASRTVPRTVVGAVAGAGASTGSSAAAGAAGSASISAAIRCEVRNMLSAP